jgi:hypothetical protein
VGHRAALAIQFDNITGPFRMRVQDHEAVRDTYVGQIVKDSGSLHWKDRRMAADETTPSSAEGRQL